MMRYINEERYKRNVFVCLHCESTHSFPLYSLLFKSIENFSCVGAKKMANTCSVEKMKFSFRRENGNGKE